jgi:hypothetical protein
VDGVLVGLGIGLAIAAAVAFVEAILVRTSGAERG